MTNEHIQQTIAASLLELGAVKFRVSDPVTFKSGIISPVYVDNRIIPFYASHWKTVIQAFHSLIASENITVEVVAGIEAAGIPHSAVLGYTLELPSVFVRKEAKAHGLKSRVEGGQVAGRSVLLVEDLVTTGGSSLSGVLALRSEDAIVVHCIAIVSYGFAEARQQFEKHSVRLHTLTTFEHILHHAETQGAISADAMEAIRDWFHDPYGWGERHGHG